jgi:hypothetical protein
MNWQIRNPKQIHPMAHRCEAAVMVGPPVEYQQRPARTVIRTIAHAFDPVMDKTTFQAVATPFAFNSAAA